jgi:hypothetical protein
VVLFNLEVVTLEAESLVLTLKKHFKQAASQHREASAKLECFWWFEVFETPAQ